MLLRRSLAVVGVLGMMLAGCRSTPGKDAPPTAVEPDWAAVELPSPPGGAARLMLRDVTSCDGRWYLVGSAVDASGGTRPVAWTSADATSWTLLPISAISYYGKQNILYSAACRQGRLAALGAKVGGAHGNPRTSSWTQLPDGTLREVTAPFELFGGPRAVNVARLVGGPHGWLISGNRTGGAASWFSADSTRFGIGEGLPELANDPRGETWSFDAVDTTEGWLMVGGLIPAGRTDRDPLAWHSPDGVTWRRVPVPGTDRYDELQRVVLVDDVPVAVGLRGPEFGVWRADGGTWASVGAFGPSSNGSTLAVRGLAAAGGRLFAATKDAARHDLWTSTDRGASWRPVTPPTPLPAEADDAIGLAAAGERLLLLTDDGSTSRIFVAPAGAGPV